MGTVVNWGSKFSEKNLFSKSKSQIKNYLYYTGEGISV